LPGKKPVYLRYALLHYRYRAYRADRFGLA
jgi:hypothetical protein